MWFLIGFIVWLLVGFASVSAVVYSELKKGEDLTLGGALTAFALGLTGPIATIIAISMLIEEYKNTVLIHGKKEK